MSHIRARPNQVISWAGSKKVEIIHRADKPHRLALPEGELRVTF